MTSIPVFDEESGFDPDVDQSPHLRFFLDWLGEAFAVLPEDLPEDQRDYQRKIVETIASSDSFDSQNDMVAACLRLLPRSATIFEILDPPCGSKPGAICYIAMDFAGAHERVPSLRLRAVEPGESEEGE